MRPSLIRLSSVAAAIALVVACGGGAQQAADTAATADSVAAAPAATPETFSMQGVGPNWSVEVTPTGIVWDGPKTSGKPDTIQFEFKEPNVNGAIREYTVIRMQPDTHRIDITLAQTKCKVGDQEMDWKAQVWVDQQAYTGCAMKK